MKQYTILRVTGNEVTCREVNPIPSRKSEKEFYSRVIEQIREEAENNLKEYPLTRESTITLVKKIPRYEEMGRRFPFNEDLLSEELEWFKGFLTGQVINGEIISENETDKVKVI